MTVMLSEKRQKLLNILMDIRAERDRQDQLWGANRSLPDSTGGAHHGARAHIAKSVCDASFEIGEGSWRVILDEEVAEALAESDIGRLREELIQVAAVCVAWVEDLDTRRKF